MCPVTGGCGHGVHEVPVHAVPAAYVAMCNACGSTRQASAYAVGRTIVAHKQLSKHKLP